MSESPDLKAEIKKSAITETVKTIVRSALLLLAVLTVAVVPPLRDRIWPAIPKWFLLVLAVLFLLVILGLVPYVLHLRRKLQDSKTELEALRAKPKYPYKFGLKWDELNPLCPHCEAHLSAPIFVRQKPGPSISQFTCQGCGRIVPITSVEGLYPLDFTWALEQMMRLSKKSKEQSSP